MNCTFIIFVYILFHNTSYVLFLYMRKDGIFLQMKKRMEQVL